MGTPSNEQRPARTREELLQASENLGVALHEEGDRSANLIRSIVTELVKQNGFPDSDIDRDVARAEVAIRHAQEENPELQGEEIYALLAETVRHGLSEAAQAWSEEPRSVPESGRQSTQEQVDRRAA